MTSVRLHNDDWGIASNCFVCEPRNERGLRIPFFHDPDQDVVTAELRLSDDYSGAPTLLHGGLVLAVLDEAMAWACIAVARRWAVTTESSARFDRPVRVDVPYRVIAEVIAVDPTTIGTAARVLDRHDRVRVSATASFTPLGEAQLRRAAGVGDEADLAGVRLDRPAPAGSDVSRGTPT